MGPTTPATAVDNLLLSAGEIGHRGDHPGQVGADLLLGGRPSPELDALAAEDGATMLGIADSMADRSLSFAGALQDLGSLLHKVALAQAVPASVQDEWPEAEEVRRLAGLFDAQEIQLFYQIANLGRSELALAPDEYAGFTMTLLRMLAGDLRVSLKTLPVASGERLAALREDVTTKVACRPSRPSSGSCSASSP